MAEVAPSLGEGDLEPDITGGLLLHTPCGDGEVPSGLSPLDPPGHHQNGLASSKHHPGRTNGHGSRAAQKIKGNLRQKTKRISEEGELWWVGQRPREKPVPLGSNPPLLCSTYIVRIREENARHL